MWSVLKYARYASSLESRLGLITSKAFLRKEANLCKNINEIEKAQLAKAKRPMVTIFDQIIKREIPAKIVYEDNECLAFEDANPQAPTHLLLIPKRRISMISDALDSDQELLGYLMLVARKLGKDILQNGFRLVINNGPDGCQSIYHLHIHILGGRQLTWPPG